MTIDRKPIIFCLVGPAGSGKTSLTRKLLERQDSKLVKLVSATSRQPRPGEVDGVNYKFLTRQQFEQAANSGEFFEWEEIHGNLYGQLRSSLQAALDDHNDIILDIDIRGARTVEKRYPEETVVIFLLPPSKEALKERILARAPMSAEELSKRMQTAEQELLSFRKAHAAGELVDYYLINSIFEDTLESLWKIIQTERQRLSRLKAQAMQVLFG